MKTIVSLALAGLMSISAPVSYTHLQEMIPDRVCVADARNKQVSIIEYAPESEAARAYQVV